LAIFAVRVVRTCLIIAVGVKASAIGTSLPSRAIGIIAFIHTNATKAALTAATAIVILAFDWVKYANPVVANFPHSALHRFANILAELVFAYLSNVAIQILIAFQKSCDALPIYTLHTKWALCKQTFVYAYPITT
jgi:hypothetical protein